MSFNWDKERQYSHWRSDISGNGSEVFSAFSDLAMLHHVMTRGKVSATLWRIDCDVMPAICRTLNELCGLAVQQQQHEPPRGLDHYLVAIASMFDPRLTSLKSKPISVPAEGGCDIYFGGASLKDVIDRVKSIETRTDQRTGGLIVEVRYK